MMKEEFKHITLPLGKVSLEEELGMYYIDMRPAKAHYVNNIYDGGFDSEGVPYCRLDNSKHYSPVNIAQYGFILHAEYLEHQRDETLHPLKKCVDKLVELATITEKECVWWHNYQEVKYNIPPPWASAMAQGEAISLFLRYYQIGGEEKYLDLSLKAFHFLKYHESNKQVRRFDEKGCLWYEEYPSSPPSYVLNGFVYALFGLYDLYRVTGMNSIKEEIDLCIDTLKKNLHRFDAGYWSYYDLQHKELVRYYYQKNVHVPQMHVLYLLTNEPLFLKYKIKWEKELNPFNFAFVQIMYRMLPRWRKLISFWK